MSKNEFFPPRPSVNPTIYAYELPNDSKRKGQIKIGFTDRDAHSRIKEQIVATRAAASIKNWLRTRYTLDFPGIWDLITIPVTKWWNLTTLKRKPDSMVLCGVHLKSTLRPILNPAFYGFRF